MSADPDLFLETDDEPELQVLAPGTVVADRYSIVEVIGQGGMGLVYKAQQVHMDRLVALKMLIDQGPRSKDHRRFQREAQAASLLDHPNIVAIHDFGFAEGQAYLCMDYLAGEGLDQKIGKSPLTLDQFRHVFAQACDALQHAHDKGMVHRDLKPSNLMVIERRGDPLFVMVLDFGLVKMMDGRSDHKLTHTNMVVGSPLYMSPEQCRAAVIDQRSDIYSLACVMYEALTGVAPIVADTVFDVMNKHISEDPPPMRDVTPGIYVPPALERVILKAMAKSPEQRYQSMKELAKAIEGTFSGAPDILVNTAVMPKVGAIEEAAAKKKKRQRQRVVWTSVAIWTIVICVVTAGVMFDINSHQGVKSKHTEHPVEEAALNSSTVKNLEPKLDSPKALIPVIPIKFLPKDPGDKKANEASAATAAPPTIPQAKDSPSAGEQAPEKSSRSGGDPVGSQSSVSNAKADFHPVNTSELPPLESGAQTSANSEAQIRNQGDFYFKKGDYTQARAKYEKVLSMNPSSALQTILSGRLTVCANNMSDLSGANDYFNKFKDLYQFNARAVENDGILLAQVFAIGRQVSDREDYSFSERLAKASMEALRRQSPQYDTTLIKLELDLNRLYADQGKYSDCENLLLEASRDAEPYPELLQEVKSNLARIQSSRETAMKNPVGGFAGTPLGAPPGGLPPGPGGPMGPDPRHMGGPGGPFGGPRGGPGDQFGR